MRVIKKLLFLILLLVVGYCSVGYCSVILINFELYKDGGSRCVVYDKDGTVTKCCIYIKTQEVFMSGLPGQDNSRLASRAEMKVVYDDMQVIMKSDEYNKYEAITDAELKALMKQVYRKDYSTDEEKEKEVRMAISYKALPRFSTDMLNKLQGKDTSR